MDRHCGAAPGSHLSREDPVSDRPYQVTQILADLSADDSQAAARLLPLVYEELRSLASHKLTNEPPDHTLQATALVHEAYLRLLGSVHQNWDNRGHFFAAAAEAMRRILVERARKYARKKHGGDQRRLPVDLDDLARPADDPHDILALDEALQRFEIEDPQCSRLVKLRYFAGLTIEQTAELLQISPATVKRQWSYARAWLCEAIVGREMPEK